MPRLVNRPPRYCKHRASGQAIVTIDGKDHYLGPHGTRTSRTNTTGSTASGLRPGAAAPTRTASTIIELLAAFWVHAEHYGPPRVGQQMTELNNYREAMKPLKRLYGPTPLSDFGPLMLKSVRNEMIEAGWCRNVVNRQVSRIKHVFKWGVGEQRIPATVHQALTAVAELQAGRTTAVESVPIKPVPDAYVEAVSAGLTL